MKKRALWPDGIFAKITTAALKAMLIAAAFAACTSAQGTDTAYVPFTVNVNAVVKAEYKEGTTVVSSVQKNATAKTEVTLALPLPKSTGVLFDAQKRSNVPVITANSGGRVALSLPAQSYKNAELSLLSVNGKLLLRDKASASETVKNISRRNTAAGIYILSVRGTDGSAFTSRLTHGGGSLGISVAFENEKLSSAPQLSKTAAAVDWTFTVSAQGYVDSVYTFAPQKGTNQKQNITLREKPILLAPGTATNPLIKGDAPDVSVTRVGNAYYMVSTTMYFMPVAPIMKSYDLVNWKIVSYCGDIIDDAANFRLETENNDRIGDYGCGQWASSIRYFNNRFWVIFKNNTTGKSYRYSTTDPDNGPWERVVINTGFHDPSIFYDEASNKTYIFHGYNDINITEMTNDLTGVKSGGMNKRIIAGSDGLEGTQAYKVNNYYYLFLINWKPTKRAVHCYRSTNIDGPFEEKLVLDCGFSGGGGVAQGGIVNTPDGDWYGVFFQDRGAVGRVPFLIPMTWSNNWPVFGANQSNTVGTVPASFQIKLAQDYETNIYYSDEFNYSANKPHLAWQWNHNPDNANWSFTERPGFLRLKTGRTSKTIYHARNTLTQRTREPSSTAEIALETTNMKDGDIAGLVVLQALCGFVGIEQSGTQKNIVMYTGDNGDDHKGQNAVVERKASVAFTGNKIYLRAVCTFSNNNSTAVFSYRTSEQQQWQSIGTTVSLRFILTHFTGARFGLFNYATKTAGGYVDFDYYHVQ